MATKEAHGLIAFALPGHSIPPKFVEKAIAAGYDKILGMCMPDNDLIDMEIVDDRKITADLVLKATDSKECRERPVLVFLGKEAIKAGDEQPFELLRNADNDPLVCGMVIGDLSSAFDRAPDKHHASFYFANNWLSNKLKAKWEGNEVKKKMSKLHEVLRSDDFGIDLANMFDGTEHLVTMLLSDGSIVSYGHPTTIKQYPWGWASNHLGYVEDTKPAEDTKDPVVASTGETKKPGKIAAALAALSGKSGDKVVQKVAETKTDLDGNKGGSKFGSINNGKKDDTAPVVDNDQSGVGDEPDPDFPQDAGTNASEMHFVTPPAELQAINKTKKKHKALKNWYRNWSVDAIVPEGYYTCPPVWAWKDITNRGKKQPAGSAVKVEHPLGLEMKADTAVKAPAPESKQKNTTPTRVKPEMTLPSETMPKVDSSTKKDMEGFFVKHQIARGGGKLDIHPKRLHTLEAQIEPFHKVFASNCESIYDTLGWPHEARLDMATHSPQAAALLITTLSNELARVAAIAKIEDVTETPEPETKETDEVAEKKTEDAAPKKGGLFSAINRRDKLAKTA
jgi:hypothetical protein